MKFYITLLSVAALAVSACASAPTGPVNLGYTAPAEVQQYAADKQVVVSSVTDNRGNDADWYGAVRGGYGNSLKQLRSEEPVADILKAAIESGLSARGIGATDGGKYTLEIDLTRFRANQIARREGQIDMTGTLKDASSGDVVATKAISHEKVSGSVMALDTGVFSNPDVLRALARETMQEGVDLLLDSDEFKSVLQ
jgi:uncharacterized lipoprotein YajG